MVEAGFLRPASRAIVLVGDDPHELLDKMERYEAPDSIVKLAREGKLGDKSRG